VIEGEKSVTARFARMGYTIGRQLVDPPTVEAARDHLRSVRAARPAASSIFPIPLGSDPFIDALAADERFAGWAAELLASPVSCFGAAYMVKEARVGPEALWHQDGHPWRERLGITEAVTLWLALDDVDESNGALRVIRASHTQPAQPLVTPHRPEEGGYFGAGIDPGRVDRADIEVLVLSAGDVSAHHPCLIHGSGPNTGDRDRRALVLRYRPGTGADRLEDGRRSLGEVDREG
jgi:phytanoyl-CoA hydroxylase